MYSPDLSIFYLMNNFFSTKFIDFFLHNLLGGNIKKAQTLRSNPHQLFHDGDLYHIDMDWFLYDRDLGHERVNMKKNFTF